MGQKADKLKSQEYLNDRQSWNQGAGVIVNEAVGKRLLDMGIVGPYTIMESVKDDE